MSFSEEGREALEARVTCGTTTRKDVDWLVESIETLTAELSEARAEIKRLQAIIGDSVPALGCHARDFSQRALIAACEITGGDPRDWTHHPDVLERLVPRDERRAASSGTEGGA